MATDNPAAGGTSRRPRPGTDERQMMALSRSGHRPNLSFVGLRGLSAPRPPYRFPPAAPGGNIFSLRVLMTA